MTYDVNGGNGSTSQRSPVAPSMTSGCRRFYRLIVGCFRGLSVLRFTGVSGQGNSLLTVCVAYVHGSPSQLVYEASGAAAVGGGRDRPVRIRGHLVRLLTFMEDGCLLKFN